MFAPEAAHARSAVGERIALVAELVARRGADAALLRARHNVAWLTLGAQAHVVHSSELAAAAIVVEDGAARALAPVNEAARLRDEELAGLPIDVVEHPWAETAPTPAGRVLEDEDLEQDLVAARVRLGDLERARLRWIGARVSSALDATAAETAPGVRELDLAAAVVARLTAENLRVPVLLVAADDRIARYRHPLPTATPVANRVMLVAVAERWGLHVALTRLVELLTPGADLSRRLAAVAAVHGAMLDATRPGATAGEVFAAAQRAYARSGFEGEWRLHHQGGLLGYRPRERIAVPGDPTVLRSGMAVAWNPSITGAKVEASFLLTDDPDEPLEPLTSPDVPNPEPDQPARGDGRDHPT